MFRRLFFGLFLMLVATPAMAQESAASFAGRLQEFVGKPLAGTIILSAARAEMPKPAAQTMAHTAPVSLPANPAPMNPIFVNNLSPRPESVHRTDSDHISNPSSRRFHQLALGSKLGKVSTRARTGSQADSG